MNTLEKINARENSFINRCGGVWNVTEGDWEQNKLSRAKIRAIKSENGQCFIGKINLYSEDRKNVDTHPILAEYKKGMVYNFGCDFVVPKYDQELIDLIRDYNKLKDGNKIKLKLNAIFDKIIKLKGFSLQWV